MEKVAFLGLVALALHTNATLPRRPAGEAVEAVGPISTEQRRALELLDDAGSLGCSGEMLTSVPVDVLAELLGDGLAVAVLDGDMAFARLSITNAGRRALDRRHALEMVAASGPRGIPRTVLQAHGFAGDTLAELLRTGVAADVRETVRAGDATFELEQVRITDAGRRALGDEAPAPAGEALAGGG
jgi:hypothetical protein